MLLYVHGIFIFKNVSVFPLTVSKLQTQLSVPHILRKTLAEMIFDDVTLNFCFILKPQCRDSSPAWMKLVLIIMCLLVWKFFTVLKGKANINGCIEMM